MLSRYQIVSNEELQRVKGGDCDYYDQLIKTNIKMPNAI